MDADADLQKYRHLLEKRLADLRLQSETSSDARKPVELDQASIGRLSRMDSMQMQAMAQAAERRRQNEVARVKAALKRIDEGEFGYCVACGEAIDPKRLDIDPSIASCIRCAAASGR